MVALTSPLNSIRGEVRLGSQMELGSACKLKMGKRLLSAMSCVLVLRHPSFVLVTRTVRNTAAPPCTPVKLDPVCPGITVVKSTPLNQAKTKGAPVPVVTPDVTLVTIMEPFGAVVQFVDGTGFAVMVGMIRLSSTRPVLGAAVHFKSFRLT